MTRPSTGSRSDRTRGHAISAIAAILLLLVMVPMIGCGGPNSSGYDASITDHIAFTKVIANGAVEPAVITGELSYTGSGTATQIAVSAKASGDPSQVSLQDMAPNSTQPFTVTVSNPSGANSFQMHVTWVEGGNSGYKSY